MAAAPTAVDVLLDAFGRIPDLVHDVLDGLAPATLVRQPDLTGRAGNSIGWLIWHLARMEDAQVADLAGAPEVHADGWLKRLGTPYPLDGHGYGQSADEVAAFTVNSPQVLADYYAAVHNRTVAVLRQRLPMI